MKSKLFSLALIAMLCACGGGGYNPPEPQPNGNGNNNSTNPSQKRPVANFDYKKQHPLKVEFSDKSTYSDGGVKWDFGDGTTSTDRNPIHKYTSKGVYNVSLTASCFTSGLSDKKIIQITITEPTKCVVSGITYEQIPANNEYYNIRCTDDYILFETCYWYTDWSLLSSTNIPFVDVFTNKQEVDFGKSEYVVRLYKNNKTSGKGAQVSSWSIYPSNIKSKFYESLTCTSNNAKVKLLFEWKD